jgi:GTP-binding protein HflX
LEPRNLDGGADRPRSVAGKQTGRVVVIGPYLRMRRGDPDAQSDWYAVRGSDARLEEAVGLSRAIDLEIADALIAPVSQIRPATYIGKGKVDEIVGLIAGHDIELVVMDCALSPIQQRNLEKAWNTKVLDRTGLILEIFGRRAKTKEGALQVELAHLNYQRSRLVRSWTHLERQRGGFGFLGGPGETQIEADRRLIDERLVRIRKELEQVRRTRGLHRSARRRVPFPVIALVGYTNAGKSTLFNALTGAEVTARDQLFATLDPTMRGLHLPSGRRVILSDTVGFISQLPHELVEAFRATLEEVSEADVILHVRDAAHPETTAQRGDVIKVLDDMVADGTLDAAWPDRTIEVLNKADLLGGVAEVSVREGAVAVSAITSEGLEALKAVIDLRIAEGMEVADYDIPPQDGARVAWLYQHGEVIERHDDEDAVRMKVRLLPADRARFERRA